MCSAVLRLKAAQKRTATTWCDKNLIDKLDIHLISMPQKKNHTITSCITTFNNISEAHKRWSVETSGVQSFTFIMSIDAVANSTLPDFFSPVYLLNWRCCTLLCFPLVWLCLHKPNNNNNNNKSTLVAMKRSYLSGSKKKEVEEKE